MLLLGGIAPTVQQPTGDGDGGAGEDDEELEDFDSQAMQQ